MAASIEKPMTSEKEWPMPPLWVWIVGALLITVLSCTAIVMIAEGNMKSRVTAPTAPYQPKPITFENPDG